MSLKKNGQRMKTRARFCDQQTGDLFSARHRASSESESFYSSKQEAVPVQEDHRARFYEVYREVAKEYDK